MKKNVVLSLSGGMDSSTLLLRLLCENRRVIALSFDYGQKHVVELERARDLCSYIKSHINCALEHKVIKIQGLTELLSSSLTSPDKEVPEGHYEQENMKETVVPNRNKMFSSIIQAVALSIANETHSECEIALGIHKGDHAIYPDCRQEFRDLDYAAFLSGNWNAESVRYYTPYLNDDKFAILQDGQVSCAELGLDFNEVYKRTNTSYKPILIGDTWFSDYKSASSVERIEAFIKLGRPDPVAYADHTGPVEWQLVLDHVNGVLERQK